MDVASIPQYQKQQNLHHVDFDDESNYFQKLSLSAHHEQKKKNLAGDGGVNPIAKMDDISIPIHQEGNAEPVDYYVPSYLQKPSLSDHDKEKEYLGVDEFADLEGRWEEVRRARSIFISETGFDPAFFEELDAFHNDHEEYTRSIKEEKAWREAHTCTSCGYLSCKCWRRMIYPQRLLDAARDKSTPVETQQKQLFPWLTNRCSPNAPQQMSPRT